MPQRIGHACDRPQRGPGLRTRVPENVHDANWPRGERLEALRHRDMRLAEDVVQPAAIGDGPARSQLIQRQPAPSPPTAAGARAPDADAVQQSATP